MVHHTHIPQSQLASAQHTTLSGNLVNQYLYHSKELQNETQWYDFGYRMYDPYTTRWNAVDSLAEATIALSPYHFVYNNPVNFVDPDGRYPRDCAHGWNPDTGECFSYTGPATYGQENDPCGGIPDCYDRGGSPMKAIDYLSQNPFADTEHYDRYLREFYGYNENSYGTGRQEYVPYGTLVMAGNSVFIRHEGFHLVERNGGFRFRGMVSAVQASGGDMNAVIGAFAKFLRLSGARQAEMDAAATGNYAGYTYDRVSGSFRPTKGQWRTRDPFVTLTNEEKVSGKGKFTIGNEIVQIGVFAFPPGAKHGSSVTGYDRSDNVNGYGHLPPGFNQGPGLILTAGGGSYQQAFLIFQSINSRRAFFNSYYTTQYNRTSKMMGKYKIK